MSVATRTETQSRALHVADSHDLLIRVQGARENNLKALSVEIPKRLALRWRVRSEAAPVSPARSAAGLPKSTSGRMSS